MVYLVLLCINYQEHFSKFNFLLPLISVRAGEVAKKLLLVFLDSELLKNFSQIMAENEQLKSSMTYHYSGLNLFSSMVVQGNDSLKAQLNEPVLCLLS